MIGPLETTSWEQIPLERVNAHMTRRILTGEKMTLAQIFMTDGFVVPQHSHVNEQVTQVISGRMKFWFGADRQMVREVGPGEIIVIPASVPHEVLMIGDVVEIDLWAPRREDWLNKTDDYLRR